MAWTGGTGRSEKQQYKKGYNAQFIQWRFSPWEVWWWQVWRSVCDSTEKPWNAVHWSLQVHLNLKCWMSFWIQPASYLTFQISWPDGDGDCPYLPLCHHKPSKQFWSTPHWQGVCLHAVLSIRRFSATAHSTHRKKRKSQNPCLMFHANHVYFRQLWIHQIHKK